MLQEVPDLLTDRLLDAGAVLVQTLEQAACCCLRVKERDVLTQHCAEVQVAQLGCLPVARPHPHGALTGKEGAAAKGQVVLRSILEFGSLRQPAEQ